MYADNASSGLGVYRSIPSSRCSITYALVNITDWSLRALYKYKWFYSNWYDQLSLMNTSQETPLSYDILILNHVCVV